MTDPLPGPPDKRALRVAQTARWRERYRSGSLAAMRYRANRPNWRPDGPKRDVRLWLPITPILILLSPIILVGVGIAAILPRPIGINPAYLVLGVGRFLAALNGSQIDIESARARVHIKIF